MAGRLKDKIAIVTGGASGIGASTARIFAREGATVVITDLQDALGETVAKEIGGTYLHHDASNEADWERVIAATRKQYGRLDVLMNNAGMFCARLDRGNHPRGLEQGSGRQSHRRHAGLQTCHWCHEGQSRRAEGLDRQRLLDHRLYRPGQAGRPIPPRRAACGC